MYTSASSKSAWSIYVGIVVPDRQTISLGAFSILSAASDRRKATTNSLKGIRRTINRCKEATIVVPRRQRRLHAFFLPHSFHQFVLSYFFPLFSEATIIEICKIQDFLIEKYNPKSRFNYRTYSSRFLYFL